MKEVLRLILHARFLSLPSPVCFLVSLFPVDLGSFLDLFHVVIRYFFAYFLFPLILVSFSLSFIAFSLSIF